MRFLHLIHLFFFFLVIFGCNGQVMYDTVPERQPGEDKIIIETNVNVTDLSIYCRITSLNVETTWEVDGVILNFDAFNGSSLSSNYSYLSKANDLVLDTNISFVTPFMASYDRLEIICRTTNDGDNTETFLFGIPAPPKLDNVSEVHNVIEFAVFFRDLSSISDPFPPGSESSTWTFDGTELPPAMGQEQGILLDTYSITVNSTHRDLAGIVIQVNVSNKHGYDIKSFSLNVQYPPEADVIHYNSTVYGVFNDSAKLVAVESLGGNPYPNITWLDPNDTVIEFPHDRFSTPTAADGVLIVNPIEAQDYGKFLFVANNGIENAITVEITLIEATEPGKPSDLNVISHDSQVAFIEWLAPLDQGTPPLYSYKIELSSNMGTKSMITNDMEIKLINLFPGTMYTVTVRGISDNYPEGGNASTVTFTTDHSTAQFRNVSVVNDDGNIVVHYDLLHNGGYGKESIIVDTTCNVEESNIPMAASSGMPANNDDDGGSGSFSSTAVFANCDTNCDFTGSLTIEGSHILRAGDTYYCNINVRNPDGVESVYNNPVTLITGRPSSPILRWESNDDSDTVTIYLRSVHAGIDPADERSMLTFHVLVRSADGSDTVYNDTHTVTKSNSTVKVPLRISEHGNYVIQVTAINQYGFSDIIIENITISRPSPTSPSPSPSSPPTSRPPSSGRNVGAIVAGVVVPVVVLAVAAAIGAVTLVVILKKTKKGRKVAATEVKVKPAMVDEAAVTSL